MKYFVRQSQFVEKKLLEATDAIWRAPRHRPVIVIQSDEGFSANPDNFGENRDAEHPRQGSGCPLPPRHAEGARAAAAQYVKHAAVRVQPLPRHHYPLLRSASYPELDFPYQYKEMRVK